MVPPTPSRHFTVVFRGGAVQHLPARIVLQLAAAMPAGSVVSIDLPQGIEVINTAEIGRILPFEEWRASESPKLAGSRKRLCVFGVVHEDDEACNCHKKGKLPYESAAARNLLRLAESFVALPVNSAARADHKHSDWLPAAIESGYIHQVASAHDLPISLPAPTHGN